MSLRKRNLRKQTSSPSKEKKEDSTPTLRLIKTDDHQDLKDEIQKITEASADQSKDGLDATRKLVVYHRINDLYQEKNLTLDQMMDGLLNVIVQVVEAEGGEDIYLIGER